MEAANLMAFARDFEVKFSRGLLVRAGNDRKGSSPDASDSVEKIAQASNISPSRGERRFIVTERDLRPDLIVFEDR